MLLCLWNCTTTRCKQVFHTWIISFVYTDRTTVYTFFTLDEKKHTFTSYTIQYLIFKKRALRVHFKFPVDQMSLSSQI